MITLKLRDETLSGKVENYVEVDLNEEATVADIIKARVSKEVELYNNKANEVAYTLVTKEAILNKSKASASKNFIDVEKQIYVALDAFQKNGFFVLIDNIQAETLEQQVTIRQATKISFIKLTPLVGG